MDLETLFQDTKKTLLKASSVALLLPAKPSLDDYFAGSALVLWLKGQGKKVVFLAESPTPKEVLELGGLEVKSSLEVSRDLEIKIGNLHATAGQLRYEKSESGLSVFISPKEGKFLAEDVSVNLGKRFDLTIFLSTEDISSVGKIFQENVPIFNEAFSLAVANKTAHKYFGTQNLVLPQFTSLSEIIFLLLKDQIGKDENIATLLLAGIYSQTTGLRSINIKAETFDNASSLLEKGAKHQEVTRVLFGTKNFSSLKLLGLLLENLLITDSGSFLTFILAEDLAKLETPTTDLQTAGAELVKFLDGSKNLFILSQTAPEISLLVWTPAYSTVREALEAIGFKNISEETDDRTQQLHFSAPGEVDDLLRKIKDLHLENT